jgi:hypothetical protein
MRQNIFGQFHHECEVLLQYCSCICAAQHRESDGSLIEQELLAVDDRMFKKQVTWYLIGEEQEFKRFLSNFPLAGKARSSIRQSLTEEMQDRLFDIRMHILEIFRTVILKNNSDQFPQDPPEILSD